MTEEQIAKAVERADSLLDAIKHDYNVIRAAKRAWASILLAATAALENDLGVILELMT